MRSSPVVCPHTHYHSVCVSGTPGGPLKHEQCDLWVFLAAGGSTLSAVGSALLCSLEPSSELQSQILIETKSDNNPSRCLLASISRGPGNVAPEWHVLTGWTRFLWADDLRGRCVFVHTSPLAAVVFVPPWRSLNSSAAMLK